MARCIAINLLFLLSLMFSSLLPTAFAVELVVPAREPPELPSDPPPAVPHVNPAGSPEGSPPPFSESEPESESISAEDLADLADKIKDLIESIISLFPASTTSSSRPALPTAAVRTASDSNSNAAASSLTALSVSPTSKPNATLACEIYQAYTSLCPPTTVEPYTTTFLDETITVDASDASMLADSARASCLCYSSAYFVPDVYDDAAWACASYTTDTSVPTSATATFASAVTAAGHSKRFCSSIGNVRITPSFATFGEFTAAATSTVTSAATPTASATGGGSTGAAGRLLGADGRAWVPAAAAAAVAALL